MLPGRAIKSLTGVAGGIGALAVDVLYLGAIEQQGATPPGGRVLGVVAPILLIAVAGIGVLIGFMAIDL